jgi:hypothetical protein
MEYARATSLPSRFRPMVTNSPFANEKSCGRLRVKLKVLSDHGRTDCTVCSL